MRNKALDFYRCLLMFGICLLHSIAQAGHNTAWAANMLQWCVPGFMFLSGWFGIRFSIAKIVKLYGICLYCAAMFVIVDGVSHGGGINLVEILDFARRRWFLNAYAVVMCFAPMVNSAVERMTFRALYPLLLCAFGWSFATTLPVVKDYVPRTPGLAAFSFLTLLGVYVVARFCRRLYDTNDGFHRFVANRKFLAAIIAPSLLLAAIGFGDYNSPFAVLLAAGTFFVFHAFNLPDGIGRVFVWLAPSMFSVYLMHSHGHAWEYLKAVEDAVLSRGLPLPIAYLATACCVFVACVVLDLPRRLVAFVFKRFK